MTGGILNPQRVSPTAAMAGAGNACIHRGEESARRILRFRPDARLSGRDPAVWRHHIFSDYGTIGWYFLGLIAGILAPCGFRRRCSSGRESAGRWRSPADRIGGFLYLGVCFAAVFTVVARGWTGVIGLSAGFCIPRFFTPSRRCTGTIRRRPSIWRGSCLGWDV